MLKSASSLVALCASTAVFAADVNKADVPKMRETFAANPARFAHDYLGKSFAASMIVTEIARSDAGYQVTLGKSEASCDGLPADDLLAFNKGDTVEITGTIIDHVPSSTIKLTKCTFSRSVPMPETVQGKPIVYSVPPAPSTRSQTLYVYGSPAHFMRSYIASH